MSYKLSEDLSLPCDPPYLPLDTVDVPLDLLDPLKSPLTPTPPLDVLFDPPDGDPLFLKAYHLDL